ncbi:MAG: hypothetical protein RLZZ437_2174 [Pseudomonadota bacterium]|jgi:hypothetical protein
MLRVVLTLAFLLPLPAWAERVMTPTEFEAYATGKTIDYADDFSVWGREEYLPGRRVRFSFTDDECRFGTWYDQGDQVCFVYELDPEPKCWTYFTDGKNVTTVFESDGPGGTVSRAMPTKEPLVCLGPQVGVSFRP